LSQTKRKIKGRTHVKINLKTRNEVISSPRDKHITALRKKDESRKSKRRQKQANYFEISHISTVLNQWPFSSFLSGSVVAE